MEDYSKYSKEELILIFKELDKPLRSVGQIASRLCELLSCEHCPVVIHKCDYRTEYEKTCLHAPCCGELHKWIVNGIRENQ